MGDMTILLICTAVAAYLGVALVVMRWLYGRWRAKYLDQNRGPYGDLQKDIDWFNTSWRGDDMVGAALTALAWPLSLPVIGVSLLLHGWMDATPVKSRRELAAERDAMRDRIAELERDLGIGGQR